MKMTQYNMVNLKLYNLHVHKLKSAAKTGTEASVKFKSYHEMWLVILMMRPILQRNYY